MLEAELGIINSSAGKLPELHTGDGRDSLMVPISKLDNARFCFLGEFGYELISWIPYLLFLKKKLGMRLRTTSRPGSKPVYYFSDDHQEVEPALIGECWGDLTSYAKLRAGAGNDLLVHPGDHRNCVNRRRIEVGGYEWTTRDIHRPVDSKNYLLPDYSFLPPWNPIPSRPLVVINNKNYVQWHDRFDVPVNSFDPAALCTLRDLLISRGYGVAYNHFVEPTSNDQYLDLADHGLFGGDDVTYDMRTAYEKCEGAADRNRIQLKLYRAASLVIGPQGGNLYLPAICRKPIVMLMRCGDYIDYLELGRLYGVEVDAFYEPRHLVAWLRAQLPSAD